VIVVQVLVDIVVGIVVDGDVVQVLVFVGISMSF